MSTSQAEKAEPEIQAPWSALAALMVGFFMLMLDTTIVVVAMPTLSADLHTDVSTTVWATSSYLLAYSVPLLLAGRLGDRFGTKRIYMIGMALFTAASLLCGLASGIGQLIAFRALQGLGAATMAPQSMATIGKIFPKDMRGRAMSYWGLVSGAAILVGPISGGLLIDSLGWRSIFFINVPIGIVGLVVAQRFVPSLPGNPHRFDFFGVVLSGLSLFCLVYALETGSGYDWSKITDNLNVLGFSTGIPLYVYEVLAVGVVLAVLFVVWELVNRNEPLVPLGIFRVRTFAAANLAIVTAGFAITAASFPGTLYFQSGRGMSPSQAALMMLPSALVSVPLAPRIGKLVDRVGPKWPAFSGLVLFSSALFVRHYLMTPDMPLVVLLAHAAWMGASSSLMMSPLAVAAMQSLPPQYIGTGSGVFNTSRQIGSTLGAAVIATVMAAQFKSEIAAHAATLTGSQRESLGGIDFQQLDSGHDVPEFVRTVVSAVMADSLLWPAVAMAIGAAMVLFVRDPARKG
ncbi:DHA2 family efflux MFS transporter permease subunit [Streptomyces sp. NBC_01352]|uniref:DHA2 family efflux MFS transporter permease subunit n=1 Tax=Streptomyces plumbiresistens TaxID=511811 RepID=A0ABP7R3H4_9ACTN|nr:MULTISPECIES: DHA2 family efflux MFS transporter permease subunit [unclassified Streptomyces]MCX4701189.1 DHA2 family efflux MFS transporter permease subunit [Streptomyces sp. NBC_01373]